MKWNLAAAFWAAAMLSLFLPGVSEASVMDLGDLRFKFSDMLVLIAVGFAWGDMREWRRSVDKRLDKIDRDLEAK